MSVSTLGRSQIFFGCLICFLIGVALADLLGWLPSWYFFVLVLLSLGGLIVYHFSLTVKPRILAFGCLALLGFSVGLWRYQSVQPDFSAASKIYFYLDSQQKFYARIVEVDRRLDQQKLTLASQWLLTADGLRPVSGRVLLTVGLFPQFVYGQRVLVDCSLAPPPVFDDFDYQKYLSRDDIHALGRSVKIQSLSPEAYPVTDSWHAKWLAIKIFFQAQLSLFKAYLSASLSRTVPEPQAALFQGLIVNDRGNISAAWTDKFSLVGLSHLIAISGSHIVVIASLIYSLLSRFGWSRSRAFWPAMILIGFYVMMIGCPASAARAALMMSLTLYAQKIGRPRQSANAVVLAAALLTLFQPLILGDVGFQLSFAAVLGLIFILPRWQRRTKSWPEYWGLKDLLLTSGAAQLATWPLVVFYFGRLSLLAPLANILVLPWAPLMLAWGFINALVGGLFWPLGRLLGVVTWFLGGYFLAVVDWLSAWPLSALSLSGWSAKLFLLIYLPIISWLAWPTGRRLLGFKRLANT